jgi:hypothetical protein
VRALLMPNIHASIAKTALLHKSQKTKRIDDTTKVCNFNVLNLALSIYLLLYYHCENNWDAFVPQSPMFDDSPDQDFWLSKLTT